MNEVSGKAYAKVNFTLDVLERQPDGYHGIRSIMQTIGLADELTLSRGQGPLGLAIKVVSTSPAIDAPADETNLAYRAIVAALNLSSIDPASERLQLTLTKAVPSQAGLGGGSSDAATALVLTNRLFKLGATRETLVRIAAQLGKDVPYFLTGGTARAEGLGERITALDAATASPIYNRHIVVVKPNVNVSTAAAYQALDSHRESVAAPSPFQREGRGEVPILAPSPFQGEGWGEIPGGLDSLPFRDGPGVGMSTDAWESALQNGEIGALSNDFQPVVFEMYPELRRVHATFSELCAANNARVPVMSGSGSAIFTIVDDGDDAARIADALRAADPSLRVWAVRPSKGGIE